MYVPKVKHTSIAIIGFNLSRQYNVSNHTLPNAAAIYLDALSLEL